jgi:hypothetical protein
MQQPGWDLVNHHGACRPSYWPYRRSSAARMRVRCPATMAQAHYRHTHTGLMIQDTHTRDTRRPIHRRARAGRRGIFRRTCQASPFGWKRKAPCASCADPPAPPASSVCPWPRHRSRLAWRRFPVTTFHVSRFFRFACTFPRSFRALARKGRRGWSLRCGIGHGRPMPRRAYLRVPAAHPHPHRSGCAGRSHSHDHRHGTPARCGRRCTTAPRRRDSRSRSRAPTR